MAKMHVTGPQGLFISQQTTEYINGLDRRMVSLVRSDLHLDRPPPDLLGFINTVSKVSAYVPIDRNTEIHASLWPALKRVLLSERRRKAREIETIKAKTPHPQILEFLEEHLKPFTQLLALDAMQLAEPLPEPRLSDYLTMERVAALSQAVAWQPRVFDEKFHILMAPELFLPDLDYYRTQADMRGLGVAVIFLDIDNFKLTFNKPYGEFIVDRFVLPRFMETVEAHCYGHGYAYRFGGDEYAMILPNTEQDMAVAILNRLRSRLRDLAFQDVEPRISLSVGLCVAGPDCPLTNSELLERATKAKNVAKDRGKDRIAAFKGQTYRDQEIEEIPNPSA